MKAELRCLRCGYEWFARTLLRKKNPAPPSCCPNCRTAYPYYLRKRKYANGVERPSDRRTHYRPATETGD